MDKKDYTIINNAKNTIPEFGDTFEKCKKEHYKTLSIASHELLNHISFLNSSYDLISKTYPETKNPLAAKPGCPPWTPSSRPESGRKPA
mgnify:CR=1 FL=1